MGAPRFSAIVVARDEEAFIRPCFERLQWCDERILVDMQSSDRTRERAADLVTAIVDQPLIPHMEFARNRGIDAATGDWILIVDADELVPELLVERLRVQIAGDASIVGVWLPRMNHCFGRRLPHVGGFPDYQLRCFRRGAGRYPDRLHSAPEIDGHTVFLPTEDGVWLVHGRAGLTIGDLVRKWDVYADKEARAHVGQGGRFEGPAAMLWAALSAFRFRFFTLKGYRDGMAGLMLSVLFAFYRLEVEAKAWEEEGYDPGRDAEIARWRSTPRLVWALGRHAIGHLWRRAQREDRPR